MTRGVAVVTNNATSAGFPAGTFKVRAIVLRNRSATKDLFARRSIFRLLFRFMRKS